MFKKNTIYSVVKKVKNHLFIYDIFDRIRPHFIYKMTIKRVLVVTQFYGRIGNSYLSTKKVYEFDFFIHFIVILLLL